MQFLLDWGLGLRASGFWCRLLLLWAIVVDVIISVVT